MCEEFQKASESRTPPRTQTSLDGATLSPCYSYHGVQTVPRLPELVCGEVFLNRQLQVNSEGTTSRSVNRVFILPDRKRLLLYLRPDRGIDCLHTSLNLRQCPISRITGMSTDAPSSVTLFDPTIFFIPIKMVLARKCYFKTSKLD